MKTRSCQAIIFGIAVLAPVVGVLCQEPPKSVTGDQAATLESRTAVVASRSGRKKALDYALGLADAYAERLGAFASPTETIAGLSRLGSALCRQDPTRSRALFLRARRLLVLQEAAEATRRSSGEQNSGVAPDIAGLRIFVMSRTVQCDPALAARLAEEDNVARSRDTSASSARAWANLRSARETFQEQPERAFEFASNAIREGLSEETRMGFSAFVFFLNKLRLSDDARANALFLQAVAEICARPAPKIDDLLALGLFLFTAPSLVNSPEGAMNVMVGGVPTINLSANRPNISDAATRAYLSGATSILTRPVVNASEQKSFYVAAYQLLPKVQQFLPEVAPLLEGAIQALGYGVPPIIQQGSSYERLDDTRDPEGKQSEARIESLPDQDKREELYTSLVSFLMWQGKVARARDVVKKIRTPSLKTELGSIVDFAEANEFLEHNQIAEASAVVRKLPAGIERCLLQLGIASALIRVDKFSAAQSALAAATDAQRLDEDQRPFVLLAAAGVLGRIDVNAALSVFAQSVGALNVRCARPATVDAKQPGQSSSQVTTKRQSARIPMASDSFKKQIGRSTFHLRLIGVRLYDFSSALPLLTAGDPAGTEGILSSIQCEEASSRALPSFVEALLANLEAHDASPQPSRR